MFLGLPWDDSEPAATFLPTTYDSPMPPFSLMYSVMMFLMFLALPWDAADACPLLPIYIPYTALQLTWGNSVRTLSQCILNY